MKIFKKKRVPDLGEPRRAAALQDGLGRRRRVRGVGRRWPRGPRAAPSGTTYLRPKSLPIRSRRIYIWKRLSDRAYIFASLSDRAQARHFRPGRPRVRTWRRRTQSVFFFTRIFIKFSYHFHTGTSRDALQVRVDRRRQSAAFYFEMCFSSPEDA